MASGTLQFSVRCLLTLTMFVAMATFGFVYWPLFALFAISSAGGYVGGIALAKRDGSGLTGAVSGGAIGGFFWLFLHLVIGDTLLPHFEDSGLGFVPYAVCQKVGRDRLPSISRTELEQADRTAVRRQQSQELPPSVQNQRGRSHWTPQGIVAKQTLAMVALLC